MFGTGPTNVQIGPGYLGQAPTPYNQTYGGQKSAEQSQQDIAAGQNAASEQNAQTAADAAKYPATLANQRFQQVYPWLQGQFGSLMGGAQGGAGAAPQNGVAPPVNTGGVWSQGQINQQVNNQQAANNQATAGQIRDTQQSVAGRGFGANSPLALALGTMLQGQNTATNANTAQNTRWNAALGNAQQRTAGQSLAEQQYEGQQQQQTARQGIAAGSLNALIASLGGMI